MDQELQNKQTGKKKDRIYSTLKRFYVRLIKIRGHPREIALGFALGIFIGLTPTMGVQTVIAIFIASIFKWNKISSAVGVWITNPVTAPVIYSVTYLIGARMMGIRTVGNIGEKFTDIDYLIKLLQKAPEILLAMTLGGIVLGVPLAFAAYHFCYSAVTRYRDDIKRKLAEQKEKLADKKRRIKEFKDRKKKTDRN